MSKKNNVNPNFYYEGDRNRQGDGIVQEEHKQHLKQVEKRQGKQGDRNFIPGAAPVGESEKSEK